MRRRKWSLLVFRNQPTVKNWLIGKEFLQPSSIFFSILINYIWDIKGVPQVPFLWLQYNFWTILTKIGHCESVELFEINERLEIDWLERNSCRSLFNQPRNLPFWWFIPRKPNLGLGFSCKKWLGVKFLQVILYQSYFFFFYNLESNQWKFSKGKYRDRNALVWCYKLLVINI